MKANNPTHFLLVMYRSQHKILVYADKMLFMGLGLNIPTNEPVANYPTLSLRYKCFEKVTATLWNIPPINTKRHKTLGTLEMKTIFFFFLLGD